MSTILFPSWSRRAWLTRTATQAAALLVHAPRRGRRALGLSGRSATSADHAARFTAQAVPLDPEPLHALVLQAVDAATTAGASYADARLTRIVTHQYQMPEKGFFYSDVEEVGVGIRVLVDGYWGFAAHPLLTSDDVVRLAQDAVQQAKENAKGTPRSVALAPVPVVTGTWATPINIDPFAISIEEKLDFICYWRDCGLQSGVYFGLDNGWSNGLICARQERIVATSTGSLFTQTLYETGGWITGWVKVGNLPSGDDPHFAIQSIDLAGTGWELFLDAKIPEQFPVLKEAALHRREVGRKPFTVGRYTLVLDGQTMASVLDQTLGVATQLDRALGYEANAGGTSFLDDPLAMIGHAQIAAPLVTVTANRSAPTQLATVHWDDEGVTPEPFTLVKDGILTEFQTTREQAGWLAPYYQQHGQPVRSHGCAAAQDALNITMQMTPNLALVPSPTTFRLEELVADVSHGLLVEGGEAFDVDFQAKNGYLGGQVREITNGQLGPSVLGGTVLFHTAELWSKITALGGPATAMTLASSQYLGAATKGEPPQATSHTVRAVAATIPNQALIDLTRKA